MIPVGSFQVLGLNKPVLLVDTRKGYTGMPSNQAGSHDPPTGEILVNLEQAGEHTSIRETIIHESIHAIIAATGVQHMLMAALGYNDEKYEAFEESIVLAMTPAVNSMLPSLWALLGTSTKIKRALKEMKAL